MCPIAASKKEMVTLWQISIFCPFYSTLPRINKIWKIRENKWLQEPVQFPEFF